MDVTPDDLRSETFFRPRATVGMGRPYLRFRLSFPNSSRNTGCTMALISRPQSGRSRRVMAFSARRLPQEDIDGGSVLATGCSG